MLQIAICDDNETTVNKVEETADRFFRMHCVDYKIITYQSSENLLYDLQDGLHFDLFLLDIEMPGVNGMELAQSIRTDMPEGKIIFITSHLEYAITAYEFAVFRYIPKTILDKKLEEALEDYYKLYRLERSDFYTIQIKNHVEQIPYRSIMYVLKEGKYAIIHLEDSKTMSVRKTLAQVYEEFHKEYFCFADRGCIVNLANVAGMDENGIILLDGRHITVSKSNLPGFKTTLLHFWGEQI